MPFTQYLKTALQDHVFVHGTTYTPPTGLYLAAYTDAPTDLGTDGTEVAGGSYGRIAVTFVFGLTTGRVENSAVLSIAGMPACTIVALAVFDDPSAGHMLAYGELTDSITLLAGDPLTVDAGQLGVILG